MKPINLLIVVAVLSVCFAIVNLIVNVGDFRSLTGYSSSTDTGTANLTIGPQASISFNSSIIDWGSGSVNDGEIANLNSEGVSTGGTWVAHTGGLGIQNDGNINVTLNLSSSKDADSFIGGTNPTFELKVIANDTNACEGGTIYPSSYTVFNTTPIIICDNLGYVDSADLLTVHINITIPGTADADDKGTIITATATSI